MNIIGSALAHIAKRGQQNCRKCGSFGNMKRVALHQFVIRLSMKYQTQVQQAEEKRHGAEYFEFGLLYMLKPATMNLTV